MSPRVPLFSQKCLFVGSSDSDANIKRNRSPDREMSLEVEVAMWREDLRMREEEAITEQVTRSQMGSTFLTPTISGGGSVLFRAGPPNESWKSRDHSSVLESLGQPLPDPRLPALPQSRPSSSLPSICPAVQERHSFSHRCPEES